MRRAMTWVYWEPKSRIKILECLGGAIAFMDASGAHHVLPPDLPVRAVRGQSDRRRLRRAEVAIQLLPRFVFRVDPNNCRRGRCIQRRQGSKRASSAHLRNEADKSK